MIRSPLLLAALLAIAPMVAAESFIVELDGSAGVKRARGETLARFRHDLAAMNQRSARNAPPASIRHEYSMTFAGAAVELSREAVDEIRKLPYVRAVHPDHRIAPFETGTSRALADPVDARHRVNAAALPTRGEGMVVAVIDSGIEATHPALAHRIAPGYDFAQNDDDPEDIEGHGTHVAGIIAADSAEISGVAPGATLVAYKVVHRNGDGKESSVVAALERCVDPNGDGDPSDHVDVVNISLGWESGVDSVAARAVDAATAAGVVVIVAAGNVARAPARITSPGVAALAITVANAVDRNDVAFDSAHGPAPGTLAFKPDVAAPGSGIPSTFRNGTIAELSGTSMAAPHVTGIAALLRKLHPGWTPAEVKAAIISTATSMNGTAFARGAGHADALAAHGAKLLVDGGLAFGVNGARTGSFESTRGFTITNRSAAPVAFTAAALVSPAGMNVTVTPSSFTLAPAASRSVDVRITAENAQLPFPADSLLGGTIRLQSTAGTVDIPWGVVRAARATVTYDGAIHTLVASSRERVRFPYLYAAGAAEMFVAPGESWDFLLASTDAQVLRVVIAEAIAVDDDRQIALQDALASRRFVLDARDAAGTSLGSLPQDHHRRHKVALRLLAQETRLTADTLVFDSLRELHVSPYSTRFHLAPLESYLDLEEKSFYSVLHPELTGDGGTLTRNLSSYLHARLRWRSDRPGASSFSAAAHVAYEEEGRLSSVVFGQVTGTIAGGSLLDVFTTPAVELGSFGAVSFSTDGMAIPLLRAFDGATVVSSDRVPSPAAFRIANGEEAGAGIGPVHPFAFFGTTPQVPSGWGLHGPVGEERSGAVAGMYWTLFAANGSPAASGTLTGVQDSPAPPIAPRSRFVVSSDPLRTKLEMQFGTDVTDLSAPTFTSLRITGAAGRPIDRLAIGEAGALHFSVADLDYAQDLQTRPLRSEALRVSYRAHGSEAWVPLQAVLQGSDNGNLLTLGHTPSGEIYRIDLSPATAVERFIDLHFEVEDAAGNRVTWTQLRAFAVGDVRLPPRRRAVRK